MSRARTFLAAATQIGHAIHAIAALASAANTGHKMSDDPLVAVGVTDPDFCSEADLRQMRYSDRHKCAWSYHGYVELSTDQMAKIIVETGLPLAGKTKLYEVSELDNLLAMIPFLEENPDIVKIEGMYTPEDYGICRVVEEFGNLLSDFSQLRPSLTRLAYKNVRERLETGVRQMTDLALTLRSWEFERIVFSVPESKQDILELAASCERCADWCQRMVAAAHRKTRQKGALIKLMGPLSECYKELFGRRAVGGWSYERPKHRDDAGQVNVADSPFIRFAVSFCNEVGFKIKPATLQKALYDFQRQLARRRPKA
jgi:hypothetical protein